MATIRFFTRTITKDKNTLVPIYVRLKSGRNIDLVYKSDILTKPENWSNETQLAKQRADLFKFKTGSNEKSGRKNFNDRIASLRAFIETELTLATQSDLTTEWLKTTIDKHWHPEKYRTTLFSYIQSFIDKSETKPYPKTGRPVCYKMRREYEVSFKYLKDYAGEKGKEIDFKDIDQTFYDDYIQFLQKKKLAVNTIGKKIQTLKIFLNAAKEENKNPYDAYKSTKFAAISEETEAIYLDEAELEKLHNLDLSKNESDERVRDLFLVGCWTGSRFSDISQITPESIIGGFIHMKQHKTGTKVIIPLHPVVTSILNKYKGVLPEPISNQKFNVALKDIAKEAKIKDITIKSITKGGAKETTAKEKHRFVTTHTARRSFATNLYKSGFPTLSIMAVTGHKTEKAFLKYIKVTSDEHAKKLQEHWGNQHLKVVSA